MKTRHLPLILLLVALTSCGLLNGTADQQWKSLGLTDSYIYQLSLGNNYLYACAGKDGLYRVSTNLSNNQWERLGFSDPTQVQFGVTSFYLNPVNNYLYVAFNTTNPSFKTGLFQSTDGGKTWSAFDEGIKQMYSDTSSTAVFKLAGSGNIPGQIYAGTNTAIFRRKADSTSWSYLSQSKQFGHYVYSIRFDPQNPKDMWAGGENSYGGKRLIHSTDGGNTWSVIQTLPSGTAGLYNIVYDIAVNPLNPNSIYVGMIGMVVKSVNGGQTWHIVYSGDRNDKEEFRALAINPTDSSDVYAAGKYLMHTTDGGATWTTYGDSTTTNFTALHVDWQKRVIYAAAQNPGGVVKVSY